MAENQEPIALATVQMKQSLAAATTDSEGYFVLAISQATLPDTLIIRHIAHLPQKMYINAPTQVLTVKLQWKENNIPETVVTYISAEKIVQLAIENITKNYAFEPYIVAGFYRQMHQENKKYVRLIECFALVEEKKQSRFLTTQKEQFHIQQLRRSFVYERNGDAHGDHMVDLFAENPIYYAHSFFLKENAFINYDFELAEKTASQYIIHFQSKSTTERENKSGYFYINNQNYAIEEIQIISTKNNNHKYTKPTKWNFQNGIFNIQYIAINGKYYVKESTKYYNHYLYDLETQKVAYIVEEKFEWYAQDWYTDIADTLINIPFKANTNLYSKAYVYDATFWENQQLPPAPAKALNDLNVFKALDLQFKQ